MTFNWGHKVLLGFVAFAGMMIGLVYLSMRTRYDLVSKDYYKDELQYQQVIDGRTRAGLLSSAVTITDQDSTVVIQFPHEMKDADVTGSLWFYCAPDAAKDRKMQVQLNETASQTIAKHLLAPGRYTVRIRWQGNAQHYYTELNTTIE
jgi:nitrogen fixation protein FixH